MPTLAELLAIPADARPETTTTVTLLPGQHLLKEEHRLVDEHNDLLIDAANRAQEAEDGKTGPRKSAEGGGIADRLAELKAQIADAQASLAEFQGEVGMRGFDGGEWQRYKDAHPPREDSRSDRSIGGSWVNATDLLNDLGQFVVSWNGEPVTDGAAVIQRITPADQTQLVVDFISAHQKRIPRAPKAQTSPSTGSESTA